MPLGTHSWRHGVVSSDLGRDEEITGKKNEMAKLSFFVTFNSPVFMWFLRSETSDRKRGSTLISADYSDHHDPLWGEWGRASPPQARKYLHAWGNWWNENDGLWTGFKKYIMNFGTCSEVRNRKIATLSSNASFPGGNIVSFPIKIRIDSVTGKLRQTT